MLYFAILADVHIKTTIPVSLIYSSLKVALPEVVKRGVLSIQPTEGIPEGDTTNP